jgi:hypothetical protein
MSVQLCGECCIKLRSDPYNLPRASAAGEYISHTATIQHYKNIMIRDRHICAMQQNIRHVRQLEDENVLAMTRHAVHVRQHPPAGLLSQHEDNAESIQAIGSRLSDIMFGSRTNALRGTSR